MFRTVLYQLEEDRKARFADFSSWELAEHFGDARAEYDAVRRAAGVLDVCYTGRLRVTGRDRVRYLHNMLSNDIKSLVAGKGCYAALLTHQGKIESDLFVYAFPEEIWLECSPAGRARLRESLRGCIVADKVEIEDVSERLGVVSIQGPNARSAAERVTGSALERLAPLEHQAVEEGRSCRVVVRRDRTGCDGYDLWASSDDLPALWRRLVHDEATVPVGHQALNWLRTEAGIPWYGVDMDDRRLPMEMGLQHAISMTKGCYRGQEIVARVLHRGNLDRSLGAIAVRSNDLPAPGAEVRSSGARAGEVTSSAWSPRLNSPLALAILKREYLEPETPVEIAAATAALPGSVVALPVS